MTPFTKVVALIVRVTSTNVVAMTIRVTFTKAEATFTKVVAVTPTKVAHVYQPSRQ